MSPQTSLPSGLRGFVQHQRREQGAYFTRTSPASCGHLGSAYRLAPDDFALNLAPDIREAARDYFERLHKITWHRHVNHGLSSQVCCLNFLMPLATRPDLLAKIVGRTLDIDAPEMLPVEEGAFDQPWFVGFEWIGERDYLNEAGKGARTRGANVTSADGVVRFRREGRIETLLIEWKYTESYGAPLGPSGNPRRIARYADLAFAPEGPVRTDLGLELTDFFWEPFYQLLRQQMLAARMQAAKEGGAERVRVLHISPAGNRALHRVTAPALRRFGDDAFDVFKSVLVDPSALVARTTEDLFGPWLETGGGDAWSSYLVDRYAFVSPTGQTQG